MSDFKYHVHYDIICKIINKQSNVYLPLLINNEFLIKF